MLTKIIAACGIASLMAAAPFNVAASNARYFNSDVTAINHVPNQTTQVTFDTYWASIFMQTSSTFTRGYGSTLEVFQSISGNPTTYHVIYPVNGRTWEDIGNGSTSVEYVVL